MVSYASQSYVFDPRPNYPFLITAKRYWIPNSPYLHDEDAYTLILTHGTSFHKELWEPALDDLKVHLDGHERVPIRELWAIDAPNHGDAAALNEEVLKSGYEPIFQWEEYGRTIHTFLSNFGTGIDVDFSKRKLIGIGHSMGACCLVLSTAYYPPVNFNALIFCELMSMNPKFIGGAGKSLAAGSATRRDIWPSNEEAYKLLKARGSWRIWDDRVVRKYAEAGMRPLPTADYPDKTEGVTLKCTRKQETACYSDPLGMSRAYNLLSHVIKRFPTHMIYGEIDDVLSAENKKDLINNAAGGVGNFASFARVEKAGHLIVQMNPRGLAAKIFDALVLITSSKGSGVHQARL